MAAKNAAKPRPSKNSDGQNKQPSMSRTITSSPAPPAKPPVPLPTPGAPPPGATNPMTHPAHPQIQSSLGTAPAAPPNPLDQIHPPPDKNDRMVQERIQFKDLNPVEQSQTAQQQGLDPYAPLKMVQQGVQGALQQGASTGPVPNMLAGPYVPKGIEGFPDDMAHLTTLMGQGFAPGASGQEHEFGLNAHAMARAKINAAMQHAQSGAGQPTVDPYAAAPPQQPGAAPPGVTFAAGLPQPPAAPQLQSGIGGPPPQQPGAAGGIPPALIAALLARHKQAGRMG